MDGPDPFLQDLQRQLGIFAAVGADIEDAERTATSVAHHLERHGLAGLKFLGGTQYEYQLDDDAPPCDIWFYEDGMYPHKRHVAAVGFPRDEMGLVPITYDEMRPGCYDPKARIEDNDITNVRDTVIWYSTDNIVTGNRILDSRYGIHLMYSHKNKLLHNSFLSNTVGIFLMYANDNDVIDNVIHYSQGPSGIGLV